MSIKTTVRLPADLHKSLRVRAAETETSFQGLLIELCRIGLSVQSQEKEGETQWTKN